ncbi:MAG: DUF1573 domain-containing protein [Planctomycetes bacterium]|nr:DUF1573 domain-containing protein [Planctomycetota bacterium]
MRRFLLPLVLLALPALAADPPAEGQGPRLHVERTILFDELIQGKVIDLKVPIHNRGDAPLQLTRAEPSCGCTVMALPTDPIPPGGRAELALRFDSSEKLGAQSLQILLYSNDPTQNDVGSFCTQLFVQGDVRSLYRVNPAGAFFGEVVRGLGVEERVVTITGQGEARRGFTARVVSATPDHLQVVAEPVPGGEGGRPRGLRLRLRLLPHAPAGEVQHVVELETDVPEQPRLRLPAVGVVTHRIVGPDALHLRVPRAAGTERRVPIERRDGRDGLTLRRLECDLPWLVLEPHPLSARRLDLVVRVPPDAPPGPFAGTLRLVLDDPDQPLVEMPVFGVVLPRVQVDPPLVRGAAEVTVRGGAVTRFAVEPADAGVRAELVAREPAARIRLLGAPTRPARLVIETDVPGEERRVVLIEP